MQAIDSIGASEPLEIVIPENVRKLLKTQALVSEFGIVSNPPIKKIIRRITRISHEHFVQVDHPWFVDVILRASDARTRNIAFLVVHYGSIVRDIEG